MGFDCPSFQIPVIDFSKVSLKLDRRSEGWHNQCIKVREACENYGCFEVVYDKILPQSQAQTFSIVKELFALPLEKKLRNVNPNPFHAYAGQFTEAPLYESCAISDASDSDEIRKFVELMWPDGHDHFRQTISSMIEQLDELNSLIEKSILDSFGLGDKIESIMPSKTLLRVQRYKAPPNGDYLNGLDAHTDKLLSAILCADQVFGLEVQTKDGQWHKLSPSPNSFIFIVGDPLMAWSNGRLHSAKHRVMMKGHEERFSLAAFPAPVEGTVIRPQKELVDEEHPQFYKEFDYMDFLKFSLSKDGMAIDALATYKLL